jgi:hypothetical protein
MRFLEKARAKKTQPDDKVDVLSQLEVVEGEKKKRKVGDARTSIPVRAPNADELAAGKAIEAGEAHVKSPVKKKSRAMRKTRKDAETSVLEKNVQETGDVLEGVSPVMEEVATAGASQAGGSSPWDPMFNPELFLERMVNLAGNSSRFNATSTDELLKMALGHELKGLLLNYALAARQRAEIVTAREKEVLVDKNLATLEEDLKVTKEKLEGEIRTLKEKCEEEVAKLVKAHEEELAKAGKDRDVAVKNAQALRDRLDAQDQRINALAKEK